MQLVGRAASVRGKLTGLFSRIAPATKLYRANSALACGVSEMIRWVPGGGVEEEDEDGEAELD